MDKSPILVVGGAGYIGSHIVKRLVQGGSDVVVAYEIPVSIFGNDYPTPDGTCVRDYVHVNDLADAHILAMEYLAAGGKSDVFNLGSGNGYSVKEVVDAVRKVTGSPLAVDFKPRRAGDPPVLVASSKKARTVLGWQPKYEKIEDIVKTAIQ